MFFYNNHRLMVNKIVLVCLYLVLAVWFVVNISTKINLVTTDIGRHIKNGQLLLSSPLVGWHQVLNSNLYSYMMPGAPFVNHHWGSGIVFYLIWQHFNFVGLSVFYVLTALITFLAILYFLKDISPAVVFPISILTLPLITSRTEIRPEVFSYFFSVLFFIILSLWSEAKFSSKYLFILPLILIIWVNLHIGFIFGLFIIGAFCFEQALHLILKQKNNLRPITAILVLASIATLLNPHGIKGALFPLQIFNDYGYRLVENQSVLFLQKLGVIEGNHFILYLIVFALALLSFLPYAFSRSRFPLANFMIVLVFGVLGFKAIRHFPSFGFVALPILCLNLNYVKNNLSLITKWQLNIFEDIILPVLLVSIFVLLVINVKEIKAKSPIIGWGAIAGADGSANFFLRNNLKGPIFNNYDIGGYLINALYPNERVFIDNRPEAYTKEFFNQTYIPMQESDEKWSELDQNFDFNAIFFSHRDYTPWGQQFLINRVKDNRWAVVYYDQFAIIMLKRTKENESIIKQFEIPKQLFKLS